MKSPERQMLMAVAIVGMNGLDPPPPQVPKDQSTTWQALQDWIKFAKYLTMQRWAQAGSHQLFLVLLERFSTSSETT